MFLIDLKVFLKV